MSENNWHQDFILFLKSNDDGGFSRPTDLVFIQSRMLNLKMKKCIRWSWSGLDVGTNKDVMPSPPLSLFASVQNRNHTLSPIKMGFFHFRAL